MTVLDFTIPEGAPLDDPRWGYHDLRCMGECEWCHGAGACCLVGDYCLPCGGCLPRVDGYPAPLTAQRWPG